MTTRPFHERAREHISAAKNHAATSAFGAHYKECHIAKKPAIQFKVIDRAHDNLRLHIREAIAIKEMEPSLNRRQEELNTGFLP